MLTGDKVVLGPVRERDLAACIDAHTEISNRGAFLPLGVQSASVLRRNYAEPENAPSPRIAERCGFQLEGTARGALFNGGRSVDVRISSLLRDDPRPWHRSD